MDETSRSERLLALILLAAHKAESQGEKARLLNLAGFSNVEIANLLETTTAAIAQALYVSRKAPAGKKSPAK